MRLCSIASGSSGNCIYVGSDNTHLLVDVGISGKRVEQGLNSLELTGKDIDGILITHEHSDHIKGLGVIARKHQIPVYATEGTVEALSHMNLGKMPEGIFREIHEDEPFEINDLTVNPFTIPHDAAQPVGYRVECGEHSVGIATDLGKYNEYIVGNLQNLDALLLEANHDIRMLQVGKYPYYLKQRILGDRGHLSNENAVPQFVSLLLVRNFFSNGGIVNTICHSIGLTGFLRSIGLVSTSYIPFLSAPGWAHVMIILINIWIGVPYQMLIATGVLMNLPSDQLESARVDGATNFQIFRKITMPYLLFVTGPALITDFVKNINNFNVIYLLTQDVYTTTNQAMASSQAKEVDLLVTWLFRLTQDYYNYKMASAIGIIVFIICAVFTLVAFNRMIKGDKEGTYQ